MAKLGLTDQITANNLTKCFHFNGVQHKLCGAGVEYESLDRSSPNLPCLNLELRSCAKQRPFTPEEARKDAETRNAGVEKMFARLAADECPACGKPIEPSRIVGRCKYGACGHRVGQV